MLDVVFGYMFIPEGETIVVDNRDYFAWKKKPEWFKDDFSARILKDIDKSEIIFEEALKDRFGHGISTMQISTGCKSLLSLKHSNGERFNGSMMGDNCAKYLLEIAKEKDIKIYLEHFMHFRDCPDDLGNLITVHGKLVDKLMYRDKCIDWLNWLDQDGEEFYENAAKGIIVLPDIIPGS